MDKDFDKKVGRIIRANRKEKRMTQKELAEKVGLDQSTIACYENGRRGMTLDTFFDICKALKVRPNDIEKQLR